MSTTSLPSQVHEPQSDAAGEPPPSPEDSRKPLAPPEEPLRQARRAKARTPRPPQHLFTVGFYTALVIAMLCLLMGALYLYRFMESANAGIESLLETATSQAQRLRPGAATVGLGEAEPGHKPAAAKASPSPETPGAPQPTQERVEAGRHVADGGGKELPPGYLETLINGRLVMARLALLSCGVSVAFAFGFLGFALFLLGVKGSIDAEVDADAYKATFARLSPGLLLLLASIILIGICVTHPTPFEYVTVETVEGGRTTTPALRSPTPQDGELKKDELPPRVE